MYLQFHEIQFHFETSIYENKIIHIKTQFSKLVVGMETV